LDKSINKGFSLIEILTALIIISVVLISLFQATTNVLINIGDNEKIFAAREIASNRIAHLTTIEKPLNNNPKSGRVSFGNDEYIWEEYYDFPELPSSQNLNNGKIIKFKILIKLKDQENYIYETNGIIN
jgi:prepilin-type N-terminal cleavage/methylation domain-containing protein